MDDPGATAASDAERAPAPAANAAPAQATAAPAAGPVTAASDAERSPAPAANAAPAHATAAPAARPVTAASDGERSPGNSGGGGFAPIPEYNCALVAEIILFCAVARFLQKHIMLDLLAETLNRWIIDRRRRKERIRRRKREPNS